MINFDLFQVAQEIAELRRKEQDLRDHLAREAKKDLYQSSELMMAGAARVLKHFDGRDIDRGKLHVVERPDIISLVFKEADLESALLTVTCKTWLHCMDGPNTYVKGWSVRHKRIEQVLTEQQLGAVVCRVVAGYL